MPRMWAVVAALVALALPTAASVGFAQCQAQFVAPQTSDDPTAADAITSTAPFTMHRPQGSVSICRDGVLAVQYDAAMLCPAWSAYMVTPLNVTHNVPGRTSFYLDPDLKALGVEQARSTWAPYNATWNRGHLAPSQAMSYTAAAKKATYTMANVAPQQWRFNQQPWRALEDDLFQWIRANRTLHIVTGVAYRDRATATRSADNVAIPDFFWKAVCDAAGGESVGFIGANNDTGVGTGTLRPVADVEALFGGPLLPTATCQTWRVNASHWFPGAVAPDAPAPTSPGGSPASSNASPIAAAAGAVAAMALLLIAP